jgi:hypothetical protein
VFEQYLSLTPSTGPFYRRPNKGSPPKFSSQVIGVHTLGKIVQTFCSEAHFEGYFTNHSGKVTCATQLFANNVDEQLIKRQTGHRSDAVRHYKRPCDDHALQVSSILQAPPPKQAHVQTTAQDSSRDSSEESTSCSIAVPTCTSGALANTFTFHSSGTQNICIINQSQKN